MSDFLRLLSLDVRSMTKKVQGYSYLPWALALSLAGRPKHEVVLFDGPAGKSAVRNLFGGGAVAVDMEVSDGVMQRTYLPLLDLRSAPIPFGSEHARDVSDTIGRTSARATAIVHGLGLSLYSLTEGNGESYVDALNVTPDTPDLAKVAELRDIKEIKQRGRVVRSQQYLGWHAAVAAARITDDKFHWEIVECEAVDPATGMKSMLPAMRMAKGWLVGVRIVWKDCEHTQWLPIMGVETVETNNGPKPMEHQPIDNPTVFQWHSAVMRCLAKGIAICTGYGIQSYAGEHAVPGVYDTPEDEVGALDANEPGAVPAEVSPSSAGQVVSPAAKQQPEGGGGVQQAAADAEPEVVVDRAELEKEIRTLIVSKGKKEVNFLAWLGVESIDQATLTQLEVSKVTLQSMKGAGGDMQPATHH